MTTSQANTTFLVRRTRYLPDALILGALVLVTLAPTVILLFFMPLQGILLATLPAGICFMAVPSFTMLLHHQETGISLRDRGLYVNIWPFALGTVPYDNVAECLYEDYGVYQALILRLKDFTRIGDDLPGMLASLRPMRTIQKKEIRFTNFTFTDDLQAIHAAITARLAEAATPAAAAAGLTLPEMDAPAAPLPVANAVKSSSADTQYSCDKKVGMSYLILGLIFLGVPVLVFFKAGRILINGPTPFQLSLAAAAALLAFPFILGNIRRILNRQPGVILLEQGIYDNAWLFPLGAVRWSDISRCEMRWHWNGDRMHRLTKTLHIVLIRPDQVLNERSWLLCVGRVVCYFTTGWKDIQIPQYAVAADLDTLKLEIDRRLAAQPGAAPRESAGT